MADFLTQFMKEKDLSVLGKNFKNEEDLQLQVKFVGSLGGGGSQFYQSSH